MLQAILSKHILDVEVKKVKSQNAADCLIHAVNTLNTSFYTTEANPIPKFAGPYSIKNRLIGNHIYYNFIFSLQTLLRKDSLLYFLYELS